MLLLNKQIYEYGQNLYKNFNDIKMPIKVNFAIQKNLNTFQTLTEEIEQVKKSLCLANGQFLAEEGVYKINPDKIEYVSVELEKLMNITQDINIQKIALKDFEDMQLTGEQMQSLLFMIEEKE